MFLVFKLTIFYVKKKKGSLLKYIEELEVQISQQEETYKSLVIKLRELESNLDFEIHRQICIIKIFCINLGKKSDREHIQEVLETIESHKLPITRSESLPQESKKKRQEDIVLPVLVFSCNRPDIRRSLDGLLKYRPDAKKFPIIVSQDCGHSVTAEVIRSYGNQVTYIQVSKLYT